MGALSERAVELFKQGYNCSQAVYGAFAENMGMDFDEAMKISSSFGGGMGRLREVCGTVSGMFMSAGILCASAEADKNAKAEQYALVQELAGKFANKNGSIVCRELLGLGSGADSPVPTERNESFYHRRPCAEYVAYAAQLVEELIEEKSI